MQNLGTAKVLETACADGTFNDAEIVDVGGRQLPAARLADRPRHAHEDDAAARARAARSGVFHRERLEEAQDDATIVAIREQERAGIDIITDGEIRRESYSNKFANALDGIDREQLGEIVGRTGDKMPVPIVSGRSGGASPSRCATSRSCARTPTSTIKITLPGPFTMTQQAVDEHYRDERGLAFAYAEAVNEEIHDLFAAGADIVQLDEPWLQARAENARRYGVEAINRALAGVNGTTALHMCFGYAALVQGQAVERLFVSRRAGRTRRSNQISIEAAQPSLDLSRARGAALEDRDRRRARSGRSRRRDAGASGRRAFARRSTIVPPERLIVTPDCGMKYLPREVAFGKLEALAAGARVVRAEL